MNQNRLSHRNCRKEVTAPSPRKATYIQQWDFGGRRENESRCKYLMPLPEEASLVMEGYESSETDAHLIDNSGNVYRYLPELDAAVHLEGLEAYAPNGTNLAFNRKLAKRISVLTLESALELLGA